MNLSRQVQKNDNIVIYSTYIGGPNSDYGNDVVVGPDGNIHVYGGTQACLSELSIVPKGGGDAVYLILDPNHRVSYFTYLGGSALDLGVSMAIDQKGDAYLSGTTYSLDFPTQMPYDSLLAGESDTFITKIKLSPSTPSMPEGDFLVYLPIISKPEPPLGVHGYITRSGCADPGIDVELRFFNGNSWSTFSATKSNSEGVFSFANIPSLHQDQAYYVRYTNSDETSNSLSFWGSQIITSYTQGSEIFIGWLETNDIRLYLPENAAVVSLPQEFHWFPRIFPVTESYELLLFDPYEPSTEWSTGPLGYIHSFSLNNLPPGFQREQYYLWAVGAYDTYGGYSSSFWARWIGFLNSGTNQFNSQEQIKLESVAGSEYFGWLENKLLEREQNR